MDSGKSRLTVGLVERDYIGCLNNQRAGGVISGGEIKLERHGTYSKKTAYPKSVIDKKKPLCTRLRAAF